MKKERLSRRLHGPAAEQACRQEISAPTALAEIWRWCLPGHGAELADLGGDHQIAAASVIDPGARLLACRTTHTACWRSLSTARCGLKSKIKRLRSWRRCGARNRKVRRARLRGSWAGPFLGPLRALGRVACYRTGQSRRDRAPYGGSRPIRVTPAPAAARPRTATVDAQAAPRRRRARSRRSKPAPLPLDGVASRPRAGRARDPVPRTHTATLCRVGRAPRPACEGCGRRRLRGNPLGRVLHCVAAPRAGSRAGCLRRRPATQPRTLAGDRPPPCNKGAA
jgi:hypothetical protein